MKDGGPAFPSANEIRLGEYRTTGHSGMIQLLYKFVRTGLKSAYDGSKWEIGKWREVEPPRVECIGLNASEYVQDALSYVQCPVIARVECGGKIIKGRDKWTCEKMRIVAVSDWTWRENVGMAVYAARLVLPMWEQKYPEDDSPRKAIEAAEAVLANNTKETRRAAWSAASAASAAWSAARKKIHHKALSLVTWRVK